MKKLSVILVAVAFGISMYGTSWAQDTIRFGCSISLTGKIAAEGKATRDGYEFYQRLINKKGGLNVGGKKYKVQVVYYDDESNIQTSTKLVEKLITQDRIDFLIGPYGSGASFATSAISEKYKKPMVLSMASSPNVFARGYKYVFGVLETGDNYLREFLELAAIQNPKSKTIAILYINDMAHSIMTAVAPELCKAKNIDIIYMEKFSPGATDFSTELTQIKAKKPDIFLFGSQTEQFIAAMKQIKELKLNAKIISNMIAVPEENFLKSMGKDAENLVGSVQWYRSYKFKDDLFGDSPNYSKEFQKMFGYQPEYHSAGASAAIEILGIAVENAGALDPEKVRNALANMNAKTWWGPVKFDSVGKITGRKMSVGQVIKGKFTILHPPELAEAKMVYPRPDWP